MAETLGGTTAGRWWEYYTVRYFVGTVVGVAAVVVLAQIPNGPIPLAGVLSIQNLSRLDVPGFLALSAAGFAYCYVASAPILLAHAVRGQLVGVRKTMWCVLCLVAGTGLFLYGLMWSIRSFHIFSLESTGWLLFAMILGSQLVAIAAAWRDRFN
jgi:hypothetical protein